MTDEERNRMALRFGLIIGGVYIIVNTVLYIFGIAYFFGMMFQILVPLFILGYLIYASINLRKMNGGYIKFKQLLGSLLVVNLVTIIFSIVYKVVLYNIIDTNLATIEKETTLRTLGQAIDSSSGDLKDFYTKMFADAQANDYHMNFHRIFTELPFLLSFAVIISLILAAIFKKKNKNMQAINPDDFPSAN